ncbi:MAG: alkaline phosphatase family protein [Solirubrobacterales bacterium]
MNPLGKLVARARTVSNRSLALLACSSVITTGVIVGGSLSEASGVDDQAIAAALFGGSAGDDAATSNDLQASTAPSADPGASAGPSAGPGPGDAPLDTAPAPVPTTDPPPTDTTDDGTDTTDDGDDGDDGTDTQPTGPFGHVFVVSVASPGYEEAFGADSKMPYLANKLRPRGTLLENYSLLTDGPLANNLAMVSGQRPNALTEDDCATYKEFPTSAAPDDDGFVDGDGCVYPVLALSIADQVNAVGGSWHAYIGGMVDDRGKDANCVRPGAGEPDATQGQDPASEYQTPHNPFVYFHSLLDLGACASNDVPLDGLSKDLANASATPDYAFIAPGACEAGALEQCGDGTDGVASADDFLADVVPKILASDAFGEDGLLLVVFSEKGPASTDDGLRVGALAVSNLSTPGGTISDDLDPYALLHTTEDVFGVSALAAASDAPSLTDDLVSSGD